MSDTDYPRAFKWEAQIRNMRKDVPFNAFGYFSVSDTAIVQLNLKPDYDLAAWFEAVYDLVLDAFPNHEFTVERIVVMEEKPNG